MEGNELTASIASNNTNKIKLNVGGQIFITTLETLTHERNTMLSAWFGGEFVPKVAVLPMFCFVWLNNSYLEGRRWVDLYRS